MAAMASGKKSLGVLVYLLSCLCTWGVYVLCLILVSKDVLHEYASDEVHRSPLAKETVAFLMIPQAITAILFMLVISAFLVDILSKNNRRIHFLTTSYINAVSIAFLVAAGFTLFVNITLMTFVHVAETEEPAGSGYSPDDGPISHDHIMGGVKKQIKIIAVWANTFMICIGVMLGLYGVYFCYWPHSLRYRKRVERHLLSNIADVDDPDDDDL